MNLSQAMRYGSYPGAVHCQLLSGRRVLAHVCRQGGVRVPYWWTASTSLISWEPIPPVWQPNFGDGYWYVKRHTLDDIMSFGNISGCYKWLKEHGVNPHEGWYPTKNEQHWDELGSGGAS